MKLSAAVIVVLTLASTASAQWPYTAEMPTFAAPAYEPAPAFGPAPAIVAAPAVVAVPVWPASPPTPPAAMTYQYGPVRRIVTYPLPEPVCGMNTVGYPGSVVTYRPLLVSPAPVYVNQPVLMP